MNCPNDEVLAAVGNGTAPILEEIEQHLDNCSSCRHTLAVAMESQTPADPDLVQLLRPGNSLGRYVLLRVAGVGGMGIVYQAFDPTLQRNVALKVIRPTSRTNSSQLLSEAKLMARLQHPNVVSVFDAGEHHSLVFLAMEWVEGETLRAWLKTQRPWHSTLNVLHQAGLGLSAAHSLGIVHRDFKPENVLISNRGEVKVTDFGLALDTHQSSPNSVYGGTGPYLAPETVAFGSVSPLVDQFSFCVTAFESFAGQRPPASKSLTKPADEIPLRCPGYILRAISRGLEQDPTARFQSMSALLDALKPRRRWPWGVATVTFLVLIAAAVGWKKHSQHADCLNSESLLSATWNSQRKSQLVSSPHLGKEVGARVGELIDDFSARWSQAHQKACSVARSDSFQSWRLSQLQLSCLRHRLDAVDFLLKAAGPQTSPSKLLDATYEAVSLRRCSSVQFLMSGAFEPVQEALQQEVTLARQSLTFGTQSALQEQADRLVAQTQQKKARAVEAEAHLFRAMVRAKFRAQMQQTSEIEAELEEAVLAGTETHHTYAVAEAELERMRLRVQDGRHEEALRQERTLSAYLQALNKDVLLQIKHDELYGGLLVRMGRTADAAKIYGAARNQLKLLEPAEAEPHHAELLGREGLVQISLGELQAARETLEKAVVAHRKAWGTGARLGEVLHNLGSLSLLLDHSADCESHLGQAGEAWQLAFGDKNPRLGINHISWAACLGVKGRFDEADVLASKAQKLFTEAQLEKKFYFQRFHCAQAEIARRKGETVKAIQSFEAALSFDASSGNPQPDTKECTLNFALALAERKDIRRARKELDALMLKLKPDSADGLWAARAEVQTALVARAEGKTVDSSSLHAALETLEAQKSFPGIRLRGLALLASVASGQLREQVTATYRRACLDAASTAGVDAALGKLCETIAPD